MKVVIPGLGTRFAGQALGIPKELLPLGGKPVIAHALEEASRAGFEAAIVVLSPAKHQLSEFLAKSKLPLPVEIIIQPRVAGIGDAVLLGWPGEPVGVSTPDDVVLGAGHWTSLIGLHRRHGAASLCVRPVPAETTSRFGIAGREGHHVISLVGKPAPTPPPLRADCH